MTLFDVRLFCHRGHIRMCETMIAINPHKHCNRLSRGSLGSPKGSECNSNRILDFTLFTGMHTNASYPAGHAERQHMYCLLLSCSQGLCSPMRQDPKYSFRWTCDCLQITILMARVGLGRWFFFLCEVLMWIKHIRM